MRKKPRKGKNPMMNHNIFFLNDFMLEYYYCRLHNEKISQLSKIWERTDNPSVLHQAYCHAKFYTTLRSIVLYRLYYKKNFKKSYFYDERERFNQVKCVSLFNIVFLYFLFFNTVFKIFHRWKMK